MGDPLYRSVITVAQGFFKALDIRLDVVGAENVPAQGGAVVVMNHVSYLDFSLCGVPFWTERRRMVRFMAKESVFRHPVSGPLMRGMHHIPVDREAGGSALRAAIAALKDGELVGVFPEATISRSFTLKEFKPGALLMARSARVPLLPVCIWGSQRLWTKGRPRTLLRSRHVPVAITVGEPYEPPRGAGSSDAAEDLRARMEALLATTQSRYPAPTPAEDLYWQPVHLGGTAPTPDAAHAMDEAERLERRRGA